MRIESSRLSFEADRAVTATAVLDENVVRPRFDSVEISAAGTSDDFNRLEPNYQLAVLILAASGPGCH